MCKECAKELVDINNMLSIHKILMILDKPFLADLWETSVKDDKETFGTYIKNISMPQYRGMTYKDGEILSKNNETIININKIEEEVNIDPQQLKDFSRFWGKGFEISDYLWLQEEFEDFVNRYESDSKGMELLIKQICLQELDIEKRRANGEKVDTQLKTLQDLLGSSNLKPVQETGANSTEQATFGTLVKMYENDKPIPNPLPEWMDADWIRKYVVVWFFGHLCKMLGIDNEYSQMYEEEIKNYTVTPPSDDFNGEDEV